MMIEQLSATSKDGTAIPYFVVRPKAMKRDGSTPTILNGYGGFQVSQLPAYSATLGKLWLERGNAFVVANIRGGGEFGPAWHEAGKGATKQKTWDDFIAVAEDLIKRKITSPRRLGVMGGSQGGLLVGTAITQRPDLFNAAIVQVPLFDMLRYHLIGNGQSWAAEYGDPTKPEERAWVEAYSPYQKLSKAQARIVSVHRDLGRRRPRDPGPRAQGRGAARRAWRALLLFREPRGRACRRGEHSGKGAAAGVRISFTRCAGWRISRRSRSLRPCAIGAAQDWSAALLVTG